MNKNLGIQKLFATLRVTPYYRARLTADKRLRCYAPLPKSNVTAGLQIRLQGQVKWKKKEE